MRASDFTRSAGRVIALAALAGLGRQAAAGITYDLRFADGSHTKAAVSGAYSLDLWVRLSGTNAIHTDDTLVNSYVVVQSSSTGGGAIGAGDGLAAADIGIGFNETGSRTGGPAQLNGDSILDWGSTATALANTSYMLVRNATLGGAVGGGTLGQAVSSTTWEFKIATFTLNIASPTGIGGGITRFDVVKPAGKSNAGSATYAFGRIDGTGFGIDSVNQQGAYTGSTGIVLNLSPSLAPAKVIFDGGPSATGSAWLDDANWSVHPALAVEKVPAATEIAQFGDSTAGVVGIDMAGATNNGAANQAVAAILVDSSRAQDLAIENSSSVPGTLTLSVDSGTVNTLSNDSSKKLIIRSLPARPLTLALTASGSITTQAGGIDLDCVVTGPSGITVRKAGPGALNLNFNASFGSLDVSQGDVNVAPGAILDVDTLAVQSGGSLNVLGALGGSPALTVSGQAHFASGNHTVSALGSGPLGVYAIVDLNAGATLNVAFGQFDGIISGAGALRKSADPKTFFLRGTGSYTGPTEVTAGTLRLISQIFGPPVVVDTSAVHVTSGATFWNQGTLSVANVTADAGGMVKGSGHYNDVTLASGGKVSPGEALGLFNCTNIILGANCSYVFEIQYTQPSLGDGADFIDATGIIDIDAQSAPGQRFVIELTSYSNGQPGFLDNFNPSNQYHWRIAHADGGIIDFDSSRFVVDTTHFHNPFGGGRFFVTQAPAVDGADLLLNYSPVPEPGAVMLGLASLALLGRRTRRV